MNIAYVTVSAPFGIGEKFILDEINAIEKLGHRIICYPIRPAQEIVHEKGKQFSVVKMNVFSFKMVFCVLRLILLKPLLFIDIVYKICVESHSVSNLIKNLIVLPKGIFFANHLKRIHIDHIHAHWETTTSTVGYICHRITSIPWSFSAHSGQILWNNMIYEKVKSVSFCRVISQNRRKDILKITKGSFADKIQVIHMGVEVPDEIQPRISKCLLDNKVFRIVCVANLDKIKGHKFLLTAIKLLTAQYLNVVCDIIGAGEEELNLKSMACKLGIQNNVVFYGALPNEQILEKYKQGLYDVLVLPSIHIEEENREEGIPVALMEAMSYGIPVIATRTGSISELVDDDISGILINDKDPNALCQALIVLLENEKTRFFYAARALTKIKQSFEVNKIAITLIELMQK